MNQANDYLHYGQIIGEQLAIQMHPPHLKMFKLHMCAQAVARAPCAVFDPCVRWKRGQVGMREFARRRHLEI